MKPKTVTLGPYERVIAVVPEYVSGPGWRNSPTWVHIVDHPAGTYRQECIQPDERTDELHTLFASGEAICSALKSAVPTNF